MIYNPNYPFNQPQVNNQFQNQQMFPTRNFLTPQETIFIPVHSDLEVINHPVAPGNSLYFKHETEPRIYIKSMGLSQFDTPKITRYKLVEEPMDSANSTSNTTQEEPKEQPKYVLFDDLKPTFDEIDRLHKEIAELREQIKAKEIVEKPQVAPTTTKATKPSTKEK